MRPVLALLCAAVAALSLRTGAQEATPGPEDGARAPAGRWYVRGGCGARTAVSAARAPRSAPASAWTYQVRGTIEGEPLLWDDLVLLAVREAPAQRALHVLDLLSGRRLATQSFPASTPLAPTIHGRRIAVRPAPDRIDVYRVSGRRLLLVRSIKAEGIVSEPLLFEGELYVRQGPALFRYDLDRNEPVWSTRPAGSFRGTPSLRGDRVWAVWYDGRGFAHLGGLRRSDGKLLDDTVIAHHEGEVPDAAAEVSVTLHDEDVFVHLPLPVRGSSGESFSVAHTRRGKDGKLEKDATSLHAFSFPPLPYADGWVALEASEERTPKWVAVLGQGEERRGLVLADGVVHSDLVVNPTAPSRAGDMMFVGDRAVEGEDFRIRWRLPSVPLQRSVPTEEGLLVVSAPDTLTALRAVPRALSPSLARAEAVRQETDERSAARYLALGNKALRAKAPGPAERFLAVAIARGAAGRAVELAQDNLSSLLAQDPVPTPDPRVVASLEREEQGLVAKQRADLLAQAMGSSDGVFQRRLLCDLLRADPGTIEVREAVRSLIPPDAPRGTTFDAASWLEFLDVHAKSPVGFLPPPAEGQTGRNAEERALAREAREWRPDVVGYASERLLVVTPPDRPGAVGSMLAVGELVCDLLRSLWPNEGARGDRERLRLFMYDTKEEYVTQSQRTKSLPEVARGWTAGHYDAADRTSRVYVPANDEEHARLLGVYAHELTHHWLATRAPFARKAIAPTQRGWWIAEGIAVLIEEFLLDPAAGTWEAHDPRAASLDLTANAAAGDLLPWERVFSLAKEDLAALSDRPGALIPRTWQLGARSNPSEIELFYAQAGAACHYLYAAEGGRHRAVLLDFVRAWYEADARALDIAAATGLSARELGERIIAFVTE